MNSNGTSWSSVFSDSFQSSLIPQLLTKLNLHHHSGFPTAEQIEYTAQHNAGNEWSGPAFRAQSAFAQSEQRYYEQIIAQDAVVPTRENDWHDLFNACIWMQFPKTKGYLNQLHNEDIRQFGLHPRTRRRNHITHFDECGVVLAVPQQHLQIANTILQHLARHEWHTAFVNYRSAWGSAIHPVIVGHANYEMLLNPFIGLTGKWLGVVVDEAFSSANFAQQNRKLDVAMLKRIKSLGSFSKSGGLPPLPLLGVPGWHHPQDARFYADQQYFRPLRNRARGEQLPLKSN